jgi:hypothetical protein
MTTSPTAAAPSTHASNKTPSAPFLSDTRRDRD